MNIIISAFKMSGFICMLYLMGGLCAYAKEKSVSKSPDLNLRTALKLTLAHHPELQRFPFVIKSAAGLEQQSRITPLPKIEASIENFLGSGNFSGTDSAELSIAYSQVFEDEDKVASRFQYASTNTKKLRAEFVQTKFQLLAETSRRYYQLLYLQQSEILKLKQIKDYQTALSAIKRRAKAGAAAMADVTRVELLLEQARASHRRLITQGQNAKYQLASMWLGQADFDQVVGQFQSNFNIPELKLFDKKLNNIPAYIAQQILIELADKKLTMEKTQSESDMNFSIGLRHHQLTSDQSLNFAFSMPLSTQNPNQGKINAAQAALEQAAIDNQMIKHLLELNFKKYREMLINQTQNLNHHQQILRPLTERLLKQVKQGFDKGQFSVLQWVDASLEYYQQQELQLTLQHQIHLTVLELERLLGQPLDAASSRGSQLSANQDPSTR